MRLFGTLALSVLIQTSAFAMVVTTLVDEDDGSGVGGVSLREAIAETATGGTITFDAALFSGGPATIDLTNGTLSLTKNVTILGPGPTC